MAVFYSFHYARDSWRVQQIMNLGSVEGQKLLNAQEWEAVKKKGKDAVEKWIDEKMKYKSAVVVLVGTETANRQWVKYEIAKAWNEKRPLVGIRIHNMKDAAGNKGTQGSSPFNIALKDGTSMSKYVPLHSPSATDAYGDIKKNLTTWIDVAYKRR